MTRVLKGGISKNAWEEDREHPLSERGLQQRFLDMDLTIYNPQNRLPEHKAKDLLHSTLDDLTSGFLREAHRDDGNRVSFQGALLPSHVAGPVIRKNLEHYYNTDTHLPKTKLQELADDFVDEAKERSRQLAIDGTATLAHFGTGALKGATLGYVDLTPNAEETAQLLGASPSLLHKPPIQYGGELLGNLADLGGLGSQVAARTAAWGTSRAANAARAALGWGAFGGAYRREGDLNFQTQFDPVGRAQSALFNAALGAGISLAPGLAREAWNEGKFFVERHRNEPLHFDKPALPTDTFYETAQAFGKRRRLNFDPVRPPGVEPGWSKGEFDSQLENAVDHADRHHQEFADLGVRTPVDYLIRAFSRRKVPPPGTEFKIAPWNQRHSYYEPTNEQWFINPKREFQTLYRPTNGRIPFDKNQNQRQVVPPTASMPWWRKLWNR